MKILSSKQVKAIDTTIGALHDTVESLKKQLAECEASRQAWVAARIIEMGPGFNILSIPGIHPDGIKELGAAHAAFIEDKPLLRNSTLLVINQPVTVLNEKDRAAITELLNKPSFGQSTE